MFVAEDSMVADKYVREIGCQYIQELFDKRAEAQDAVNLLMIAKYYERIGDHAENVAAGRSAS